MIWKAKRNRLSETRTKLGMGLVKLVVALRPSNWRTETEATDMVAAMAAMVTVMAPRALGIEEEEAGGMQRRQGREARGKLLLERGPRQVVEIEIWIWERSANGRGRGPGAPATRPRSRPSFG